MAGCDAFAGLALFACLARDPACLPPEHRPLLPVLAAMAERESGFRPLAIRDEATGESIFPRSPAEAVRIAGERDARGHVLGLGLMQITHRANWRRHGLTVETALDPCRSLRAGAAHLADAVRAYNGSGPAAERYAAAVVARVGQAAAQAAPPAPPPPPPPRTTAFGRRARAGEATFASNRE